MLRCLTSIQHVLVVRRINRLLAAVGQLEGHLRAQSERSCERRRQRRGGGGGGANQPQPEVMVQQLRCLAPSGQQKQSCAPNEATTAEGVRPCPTRLVGGSQDHPRPPAALDCSWGPCSQGLAHCCCPSVAAAVARAQGRAGGAPHQSCHACRATGRVGCSTSFGFCRWRRRQPGRRCMLSMVFTKLVFSSHKRDVFDTD